VKPQRKLIVGTAQGWYESAHDYTEKYSPSERVIFMENALNHTENALFASNKKIEQQATELTNLQAQMALQTKALKWMKSTADYFKYKAPEQIDGIKVISAMSATAQEALSERQLICRN